MIDKAAKEPLLALLLSILVPGLGQRYNGEVKKGVWLFVVSALFGFGTAAYILGPLNRVNAAVVLFPVLYFALIIYGGREAYLSAKKYNLGHGLKSTLLPDRRRLMIAGMIAVPIVYYLAAPLLVNQFICRAYKEPPNSMEPTIYKGERVLVNLLAYKKHQPQRGDLVLYRCPDMPNEVYLHRVVGLPGESVLLKDHMIMINGVKLTDKWAANTRHYNGGTLARRGMKPVIVPQGFYFVLGDYSGRSRDSRYWGCLPEKNILGKGYKICYPFKRSGPLE